MKIQIVENVEKSFNAVVYTTNVTANGKVLSSCVTATIYRGTDEYENVQLGVGDCTNEIYKEFEAVDESDVNDFIENLCYEPRIEKALKYVDFDEV